jgi:predicted ATPase
LAAHFIEGGDAPRAAQYLQQAARTALRRSAHQEAKLHLTRALDWLPLLPETAERMQRELDVHLMLGVTLMSTQGVAAPQVQQTYAHAHRLCQQLGQTPQLFPALWGLRSFYHVRAEYHTAREIAEQLLQLAQITQNTDLLVEGHLALGVTCFFLGEVLDARTHLEESLRWYDPPQHRAHAYLYGQDPAVLALCHLAPLLFGIGFPDQAATLIQQAVARAEEMTHPFSLGYARCFAAAVYQGRRDPATVIQHAQEAATLAQAQGFPHFLIMSSLLHGWAQAALGKREEGLVQLQQALEGQVRIGFDVGRSYYLTQLAEVYASLEQSEQGLRATEEGLERVKQKSEGFFAAELYRLKGELTLQQAEVRSRSTSKQVKANQDKSGVPHSQSPTPNSQEAEACFLKAIEIARQQHTKLFELRAVMSLSRLRQKQGKKQQARRSLADLYSWFTEGFDTPD